MRRQNAEIKLGKLQTHNFDSVFSKPEKNWRWNKAVLRRRLVHSDQSRL